MNFVNLTATIAAVISFLILIFKNCFGTDLFGNIDPGTVAPAVVTIIGAGFAAWKAISATINATKAKAADAKTTAAEIALVKVQDELKATQTRYAKAIAGIK
jgi:arginine exporter protein ArgO